MKTSVEKFRKINNWLNNQNEAVNYKLKTISDIEKVYDYCAESELISFVDQQALLDLSTKEYNKVIKEITDILGYSIF